MPEIHQIIIVALLSTFIILFLIKTGLRYKLRDFYEDSLISKMLDCDFCISFWTSVFVTVVIFIFYKDASVLTPFCATPIIRFLI